MTAVDTNILTYAHRGETELRGAAASRPIALAERLERWAIPVVCVAEFMRVVTHHRVFDPPSTMEHAIAFMEGIVAAPNSDVVRPDSVFLEFLLMAARNADARGNLIFDAQNAACAGSTVSARFSRTTVTLAASRRCGCVAWADRASSLAFQVVFDGPAGLSARRWVNI